MGVVLDQDVALKRERSAARGVASRWAIAAAATRSAASGTGPAVELEHEVGGE